MTESVNEVYCIRTKERTGVTQSEEIEKGCGPGRPEVEQLNTDSWIGWAGEHKQSRSLKIGSVRYGIRLEPSALENDDFMASREESLNKNECVHEFGTLPDSSYLQAELLEFETKIAQLLQEECEELSNKTPITEGGISARDGEVSLQALLSSADRQTFSGSPRPSTPFNIIQHGDYRTKNALSNNGFSRVSEGKEIISPTEKKGCFKTLYSDCYEDNLDKLTAGAFMREPLKSFEEILKSDNAVSIGLSDKSPAIIGETAYNNETGNNVGSGSDREDPKSPSYSEGLSDFKEKQSSDSDRGSWQRTALGSQAADSLLSSEERSKGQHYLQHTLTPSDYDSKRNTADFIKTTSGSIAEYSKTGKQSKSRLSDIEGSKHDSRLIQKSSPITPCFKLTKVTLAGRDKLRLGSPFSASQGNIPLCLTSPSQKIDHCPQEKQDEEINIGNSAFIEAADNKLESFNISKLEESSKDILAACVHAAIEIAPEQQRGDGSSLREAAAYKSENGMLTPGNKSMNGEGRQTEKCIMETSSGINTQSSVTCSLSPKPVRIKPDLPPYLTLGWKLKKSHSIPNKLGPEGGNSTDINQIGSILQGLDFSKFHSKSRTNEETERRTRSASESPSRVIYNVKDKPPIPHTTQKLRELTLRLQPSKKKETKENIPKSSEGYVNSMADSSGKNDKPSRGALPKKPMPLVSRSASFSQVDLSPDGKHVRKSMAFWPSKRTISVEDRQKALTGTQSLPRSGKIHLRGFSIERNDSDTGESSLFDRESSIDYTSDSTIDASDSTLEASDSNIDITDEGLEADSDSTSKYLPTYSNVTASSAWSSTPPRSKSPSPSPGNTLQRQKCVDIDDPVSRSKIEESLALNGDKRKRRKGIANMVGTSIVEGSNSKSGNGRSLTYPPQRKQSLTDESEYLSIDSNGLGSLNSVKGASVPSTPIISDRQVSEASLADSQLCPSEITGEMTYQEAVESIINEPSDINRMDTEERNDKALKKKYYSDPSGEKNKESVSLPQIIATCKSESELPDSKERTDRSESPKDEDLENKKIEMIKIVSGESTCNDLVTPEAIQLRGLEGDALVIIDPSEKQTVKSPVAQRRYSKRRPRGPFGEMLEEEMRRSERQNRTPVNEINFINELMDNNQWTRSSTMPSSLGSMSSQESLPSISRSSKLLSLSSEEHGLIPELGAVPKRKTSATYPAPEDQLEVVQPVGSALSTPNIYQASNPFFDSRSDDIWTRSISSAQTSLDTSLFCKSPPSSPMPGSVKGHHDTRTHVVKELYDTEKSYVESLQIVVHKYLKPLKGPEFSSLVDSSLVDDMFFQIPEILTHHETFLEGLKTRLDNWDNKQKVGDVIVNTFTRQPVIDTYTAFINNWKSAKEAIKIATQAKSAFAKFLEQCSREHKGKLTLDALLIMPVQRIPRYELLIKELLKHTQVDHPDHRSLILAQKEVHELALKINRIEREADEAEQMQQKLKEIENLIEGLIDLVDPDRRFIRHDLVTMCDQSVFQSGTGAKKDRCLFLFSDILIITSIKKKSGTIRKASASSSPSLFQTLESNKYKLLMRISLDDLEIAKYNNTGTKKTLLEKEQLEDDLSTLHKIGELAGNLYCSHQSDLLQTLDEVLRDLVSLLNRQLTEKQVQNSDPQLMKLDLMVTTQDGIENITVIFPSVERRALWEQGFQEAKQSLALSMDRRLPPEFMYPLPIRKTRAGLQFTCAAPTLGLNTCNLRDVWVCNSDGYVGQVCVLSLQPEPTVTSCNGVCNARILCIASIPAPASDFLYRPRRASMMPSSDSKVNITISIEDTDNKNGNIDLDSDSSDDEEDDGVDSPDEDSVKLLSSSSIEDKDSSSSTELQQPTMWLGTEDGCIHVYNCNDNIRIKKNKVKIQHTAAIHCIIYLDNRVFVSLANGDLAVYQNDPGGGWDTNNPQTVTIGSATTPITRMQSACGKIWCSCHNMIIVVNTTSLTMEHSFSVSNDTSRSVLCIVGSGLGIWISIQNSAVIKLFHAMSYECLLDINVTPTVTKMLSGCDDIIRQHKVACLRVTSLLTCKDLLWVGTSAGVILNLVMPHITPLTAKLSSTPNVVGISHGHTGHVRFLTCVELSPFPSIQGIQKFTRRSFKAKDRASAQAARRASTSAAMCSKMLVISGGDGYEDFRNTSSSESAGRDDSTNHLLLWQV